MDPLSLFVEAPPEKGDFTKPRSPEYILVELTTAVATLRPYLEAVVKRHGTMMTCGALAKFISILLASLPEPAEPTLGLAQSIIMDTAKRVRERGEQEDRLTKN